MKTWKQIDPNHFDSVKAGQTVRVKWERGPEVSEVEGYVAFVSENFGEPVDLAHMVEDYRELCILHHHEAFWYRIIGFMDVWVLGEAADLFGADSDSVAEYYVRKELLDHSVRLKRMELCRGAYGSSSFWGDKLSQRQIEAAIDRLIEQGEILTEEVPRDSSGRIGGTLHWLAK